MQLRNLCLGSLILFFLCVLFYTILDYNIQTVSTLFPQRHRLYSVLRGPASGGCGVVALQGHPPQGPQAGEHTPKREDADTTHRLWIGKAPTQGRGRRNAAGGEKKEKRNLNIF